MDSTLFSEIGRELAPEQVTTRLRDAITSGALRPGERLNQAELAKRLGVSRMPVREALRRLEAEGLVTLQPYRGAVVAAPSAHELREIYEIRIALEGLALRLAVPRMAADTLARMEATLRRMDDEADSGTWLALNAHFHDLLYADSERALLLEHIANLRNKSDRFLKLFAARRDRTAHAQEEHWEILRACRERDAAAACRRLQAHLQSTIASLSDTLNADEAPDEAPDEGSAAGSEPAPPAPPEPKE